jgi:hypothetical protein
MVLCAVTRSYFAVSPVTPYPRDKRARLPIPKEFRHLTMFLSLLKSTKLAVFFVIDNAKIQASIAYYQIFLQLF